jgi:glycosyltransferase involved in cell wall biosynthesis
MHIAFLTPEYPHEKVVHAAGIGTSIMNLVAALQKKGCAVTVIVYAQKKTEVFIEKGIRIHLIEDRRYSFAKWYFYRKHIQNYCNKIIKEESIDILEAPDWTGITAFMSFRIPLVIRFHGSDTYFCHLEKRNQKIKNFWFEKLAIQKATAFIAPTTFAGNLSKELFDITNKKIQTIHYGLELEKFENLTPENYEKGLILYIGTVIRKKGVLELPAIFSLVAQRHPEARLVLIGGDSYDVKTQSKSTWALLQEEFQDKNQDKVTYLGKIPYQEIQSYIKKAHICVFPTYAETLGMVTIESMAMQKPVVNSNIGWAQELLIDGESGYLVYPENHQLYADRIGEFLTDENLCRQTGKTARKRVELVFDIEKVVEENIHFYKGIIKFGND